MSEPHGTAAPAALRVARNALALLGSKVLTSLILFGWQLAVARELGPSLYGVYGAIGAMLAVAAVLPDLGLGIVVARETARRPASAPRILTATLVLQPALSLLAAALVTGLARRLGIGAGFGLLVPLAALTLVTDTLGNLCHSQLVGAERLVAPSVIALVHTVILVGLGALLLRLGLGLWGVYGAMVAASLVRAAVYWERLILLGLTPEWPVSRLLATQLVREGWPIALLGLVGLGRLNLDRLVVTRLLGTAATGELQAAFVVAFGVVEVLSVTLLVAVFPLMARTFHEGPPERYALQVERLTGAALLVGLPLAFGGELFARRACILFFGPAFEGSARLLLLMLWAAAAAMVGGALGQALIVQGRQRALLAARSGVLAAFAALLLVLVPRIGLVGAPIASLATEVAAVPLLGLLAGLSALSWKRVLGNGLKILLAAGFATFAAGSLDPRGGILALGTIAVLYPAGIVALRVVSREESRRLGEIAALLIGRAP